MSLAKPMHIKFAYEMSIKLAKKQVFPLVSFERTGTIMILRNNDIHNVCSAAVSQFRKKYSFPNYDFELKYCKTCQNRGGYVS